MTRGIHASYQTCPQIAAARSNVLRNLSAVSARMILARKHRIEMHFRSEPLRHNDSARNDLKATDRDARQCGYG